MRKIAEELSVRLWVLIHADRVAMSVEESESGELRYRSGEKLSILNTKIWVRSTVMLKAGTECE